MRNRAPLRKISRRYAAVRFITKRLLRGEITGDQAEFLISLAMTGQGSKRELYGFNPTKSYPKRKKRRA